jgi:UDP-N-acetylglucosamine--N-acetylmuramyl-(pentapeptide) pyrophosphoryl-undecaprenol N-acetylglucosamine transferase
VSNYKFIISGGGTGGHIYPAIAIGKELQAQFPDAEFLFVGAKNKMEMQKVPKAGFKIKGLWIAGLQRRLGFHLLTFPIKLIWSLVQASFILMRYKPTLVIGTGGYASGPLLKMAGLFGYPYLIQEQNSYAGKTNVLLAKKAKRICVAYEHMERYFPADQIAFTGNPVREDLIDSLPDSSTSKKAFGLEDQLTLLVLGGSLGARRINQLIASHIDFFRDKNVQLIWQCGSLYIEEYQAFEQNGVRVLDFIEQMPTAFAAADLIISRSGASTVSELALVGKPVLFIPSPNVAEDHQTKNAKSIVDHKAALMLSEKELEASFKSEMTKLIEDETLRNSLGANIKELAKPHATKSIVEELKNLLNI